MPVCRAYDPADRDACVALLRAGHDPRFDLARFRWLHEEAPGGPSRIVVCTDEGGKVVGLTAVIPRPAWLDGRPVLAGRDVDPVVDPSCRGQGVFSLMLRWLLEHLDGVQLLYNFANPVSAPGFLKNGWREAGYLADRVVQLGYARPFGREHLLHLATWPLATWPYATLPPARRSNGDRIVELAAADLAGLPEAEAPPRGFGVRRSAAHLAWRYGGSPMHAYRIFVRERDGAPVGCLVLQHDPRRRRLVVMDVAAYGDGGGELGPYLPTLRRTFGDCWICAWTGVPAAWRRGFLGNPRSRGQRLLVRAAPGHEQLAAHLTAGDMLITHGDVEAN